MRELGRIVRLQVQRSSLKVADGEARRYDPSPIMSVPGLRLTREGVVGLAVGWDPIVDVHNELHPATKNSGGRNDISIGFTSHYRLMRERFGSHVLDGVAGENVLVECEERVALSELEAGLVLSRGPAVELAGVRVAEPCEPFTRWALAEPVAPTDRRITEGLQFLREGIRGFYGRYEGEPTEIRVGDRVFLGPVAS